MARTTRGGVLYVAMTVVAFAIAATALGAAVYLYVWGRH
jgi:hypothetical protein